ELITSFDGGSFHMPPEQTGAKAGYLPAKDPFWLHTDQSYTRNGFECIQSWIGANDTNDGDGTLSVLEASHKLHAECGKKFGLTDPSDWYRLTAPQIEWYTKKKK